MLTDAKLQGYVTFVAGSDEESGPITLEAFGHLENRVVLNLSGGQRQEVQNNSNQGALTGIDGQQHPRPLHNSVNPGAWFLPALLVQGLTQDPNYSITYIGVENLNSASVHHFQAMRTLPGKGDAGTMELLRQLTAFDLYVDTRTFLPVALEFSTHPDNNALQDLPVRIEFSDYRNVAGVVTPFHVQKFLQHSPLLDISITSVVTNSGLPPGDFQVQ